MRRLEGRRHGPVIWCRGRQLERRGVPQPPADWLTSGGRGARRRAWIAAAVLFGLAVIGVVVLRALVVHRLAEVGAGGRANNNNGLTALCGCPRKIRLSPATYELGPIVCGMCRQPFTAVKADESDAP